MQRLADTTMTDAALYNNFRKYCEVDDHRTGHPGQQATIQWLRQDLIAAGAKVALHSFRYSHYDVDCSLRSGKESIRCMPLYYSSQQAQPALVNVLTSLINLEHGDAAAVEKIRQMLKTSNDDNSLLVVGTVCPNQSLYAINTTPDQTTKSPVLLVAQSDYQRIEPDSLTGHFLAVMNVRESHNVIAGFNFDPASAGPKNWQQTLAITTPISGWFECAGERGTGLAIALGLARQMALSYKVALVLTTGHELGYCGGFAFAHQQAHPPVAVIHIGSCVGANDAKLEINTNIPLHKLDLSRAPTATVNQISRLEGRESWVGESECWAHFQRPMISIAGQNADFHTPLDVMTTATSPRIINRIFDQVMHLVRDMPLL